MNRTGVAELQTRLGRFPRAGLTRVPTPLEPLRRLSDHLRGPKLWVKREDCTGFGFGGNTLRKLDFVLAEALAAGADTLVSGGVVQSNSLRQVAAAGARLGLACHLALFHGRVQPMGAEYESSGNILLSRLFGATLHHLPWSGDRMSAIRDLAADLEGDGRKPFLIPYGVSSALGAVGCSSAALEITTQCHDLGFEPAAIVHASGSGATQAGLIVGSSVCLPHTEILGIDVDGEPARVHADVVKLAGEAANLLGVDFEEDLTNVLSGYAGPGYGIPDEATIEAMKLGGSFEALILDPVYSGKGMAALLSLVHERRWASSDNVVFIHTGGEPAIFAYQSLLV